MKPPIAFLSSNCNNPDSANFYSRVHRSSSTTTICLGKPSTSTGYWLRESELANLQKDPTNIANKLGLPPGMQVDKFDVYQITPKQGAVVFESKIAPTAVNGVANTTGGATQTIVVDRTQFTLPIKTGSIDVKKGI